MAHLSTYGADFSVTKKKAIEDAKKMQIVVQEECQKAEQDVPPYLLRELIGKGSFGRVYKASDLQTSQLVAVKIIDIEESDTLNPKLADTYSEFLKEINALKLLSEGGAKNINHVLDALPVGQSMWMVTEYCAGGSVATLMKPTAPGGLQEKWIIPILREVAEAVSWVHKAGIIHRDIKCANVLITEGGGVQLCDFGVSGVIETKFDKRSTFIGTPHWMAPELFDPSASYGVEVDIWAFGSMVFEIASGLPPNVMAGIDITQLGGYLKQNTPRLEGKYSEKLKDLVSFCLVEDPAQRPTINDVQRHPYLHNTSSSHPTSSLAMLVRAFRMWESQGGSRKSLFAFGGAQGPSGPDLSSTAMSNDEWNFSTTLAFDQRIMNSTDAQAVYDVYGSNVDLIDPVDATPQPYRPKRRRPPPNLPVMRAPLEKIFDPNTISSYNENARAYYGKPPSPPPADIASDLPLRNSSHNATLRESLIDLDASLHGSDLSRFVDMNTVRASTRRSNEYDLGEDYSRAPNSDPETVLAATNRKTQDWKFPTMVPPASASAEMLNFPFNEDRNSNPDSASDWKFPGPGDRQPNSASDWKFPGPGDLQPVSASEWKFPGPGDRPPLLHHPTEPLGFSPAYSDSLMVPRAASQMDNRASVSSLIDLDESLPEPVAPADIIRPSTANSDVASDIGGAFDLERHTSYYPLPSTNREPSIYISDESDLAGMAGHRQTRSINMMGGIPEVDERQRRNTGAFIDDAHLYSGDEYNGSEDYMMTGSSTATRSQASYQHDRGPSGDSGYTMTGSTVRTPSTSSMNSAYQRDGMASASDGSLMPPLPAPPSERVMMGEGGELMRDDFLKLLESMTSHLSFTGEFVANLPTRKSGRGQETQNGQ